MNYYIYSENQEEVNKTYSLSEMQKFYNENQINENTYIWKEGYNNWLQVNDCNEIMQAIILKSSIKNNEKFESSNFSDNTSSKCYENQKKLTQKSVLSENYDLNSKNNTLSEKCEANPKQNPSCSINYEGLSRSKYFLSNIGLFIIITLWGILKSINKDTSLDYVNFILIFLPFIIVGQRLLNIGMNPWYSILILVPGVNLYIFGKCSICPTGYQKIKKIDTAGKIIGIIYGFFVAVTLGSILFAIIF